MEPFTLEEYELGEFTLTLDASDVAVQKTILASGHEPNGYFWENVSKWIIQHDAPELASEIDFDPEAQRFFAYGSKEPLTKLGNLLAG